ncbi:MAG TPA: alpha/beta fold hydrolase, partial [Spongiibacteraceae bacterium]|nr:alpha/beta fold hydrolase [Spongiibacteraceae bacterium]
VFGWANFQGNLPTFAEHFQTYILDMPGYGGSSAVDGNPIAAAVDATLRFMDKMGIAQTAFVGNSMGGMVATHLAAAHPERVTRLCTIGGVGTNLFSSFPNEGINLLVEFTEQPTRERLIAWLRSMVYDQSLVTEELIEDRWRRATNPETLAVSRRMYSRAAMQAIGAAQKSSQPWAHLQALQCPTLITWGRDDRVTPVDWAILPMRLIPKCELHVFYDCGHWAMIERKHEFESVVLAFLRRA